MGVEVPISLYGVEEIHSEVIILPLEFAFCLFDLDKNVKYTWFLDLVVGSDMFLCDFDKIFNQVAESLLS